MKHLILLMFICSSTWLYGQSGAVSGQIVDGDTNEPLIGATVMVQGSSNGVITDLEGNFKLGSLEQGNMTLLISYVGYEEVRKTVDVSNNMVDLGVIKVMSSAVGLNEVMVIASVGVDRKTPVAMSNVKAAQIEAKIGSQEFPEILKSTPGIYATRAGGGFGDGRVNIRGFNDENVAVLINGIPVNDMENGNVYWSNWAGLTDATNTMQVQRGLGASKVAVPSIGGTINIISKASEREQGGDVYMATGNDAYSKLGFQLSSGLNENGWAFTIAGSKTQGEGFVDGTEFLGFSYFANIAKKINDKHEVTFTAVGAKQRHGQRQSTHSLATYEAAPSGIKYNSDWGIRDGKVVNVEDNFYHKPQLSLNHYWTVSEKTEVSTAVYASFGTGGGGGTGGEWNVGPNNSVPTTGSPYDPMDIDALVEINKNNPSGESLAWQRASRNDHNWFGLLSTINQEISSNLNFMGGIDIRSYTGKHFYEVTDLLGGEYIVNNDDENNPNRILTVGDKYNYNYDGKVGWQGIFGQVEYSQDALSAFITLSVSNTSYHKLEYFNQAPGDEKSESVNFLGYQVKGGLNYNLTDNHNVYFNAGYFSKAPFFRNVFLNRTTNVLNEDAENEKILSTEIGYGYRSANINLNVNVYRTQWNDRSLVKSLPVDDVLYFANILGINALHQGIEVDGSYDVTDKLTLTGMVSIGDWKWVDDVENVFIQDEDGNEIGDPISVYSDGLKVGDAAQTTAAAGITYKLMKGLSVSVDYTHGSNLYASFDPTARTNENDREDSWKVPAYNLVDLNLTYDFDISDFKSTLYANIYNIGDVHYVADANDGSGHDAASASVYYAAGLTWNLGFRVRF